MGWVKERADKDGNIQYTAVYRDLQGRERSAGTWSTKKRATAEWHLAEAALNAGKVGDPKRGRQRLSDYVENEWFPNHVIEASTRENYRYWLDKYVLPGLGYRKMVELLPFHVREWVTKLQSDGVRPPTIREAKVVLDAILSTALNEQVVFFHAGRGVKTPVVAKKARRIITVEQYDAIHKALTDETMQLLVETDIESGLRWGELTELRVKDLDLKTGLLTVARVVVELKSKDRPDGERFLIKEYPKDGEWRQFVLAPHLVTKIENHITRQDLGPEDLLFELRQPTESRRLTRPERLPDPSTLGLTEPNAKGRQYPHGTTTAYGDGRCRCQDCKNAVAAYRAARRAAGKDHPTRPRRVATDGHIPNNWFRNQVWKPALKKAKLGFHVTPHDMRHAHASWVLAGGADIRVVQERLGHASITTTEKYLHSLPGKETAALKAMDVIRGKRNEQIGGIQETTQEEAQTDEQRELAELRKTVAKFKEALSSIGADR